VESLDQKKLKKRRWKKVEPCEFCDDYETIEHLFFLCPLGKYVWSVASVFAGTEEIPQTSMIYTINDLTLLLSQIQNL
jgi:hypothetical protein